jgi:hypothetical protein
MKIFSKLFEFKDKEQIKKYYKDYKQSMKKNKNDDLGYMMKSGEDIPDNLYKIANHPNPVIKLMEILSSNRKSKPIT